MQRGVGIVGIVVLVVGLAAILTLAFRGDGMASKLDDPVEAPATAAIPLAVMGDSGSHSYQDSVQFNSSQERGGALRPQTFQWTEVLGRLRPDELDLGPWVRWGWPTPVAQVGEWLGLHAGRAPRKEDYLYNFAMSGAGCQNLLGNRNRQAPRLVALMNAHPERWRNGVVVIRIGGADFQSQLDLEARDPTAPEVRALVDFCAREIRRTVELIHSSHPSTRIVLVGVPGEADDPLQSHRWQSAVEMANIRASLSLFNGAIRQLATGNPLISFFDDAAWLTRQVGERTADGKPDYKTIAIGPNLRVTNTVGDDPRNTVLADDHNGVVLNTLWAQSLVQHLIDAFGKPLTPIGDEEVVRFLEPLFDSPRAPGS